ncbi:unnamed protein product, partial [Laminaria digitata]
AWHEKACTENNQVDCILLGEALLEPNRGYEPDHGKARSLFEAGCSAGFIQACALLAKTHSRGALAPRDKTLAGELDKLACRGGSALGCMRVGIKLDLDGKRREALPYQDRACQV